MEQHRYTGTLSKEKKAFESLIDTKEHMVISLPDHSEDLLRWGTLTLTLTPHTYTDIHTDTHTSTDTHTHTHTGPHSDTVQIVSSF